VIREGSTALPLVIADAACDVAVTTSDTLEWQTSPAVSGVGTIVRAEGGGKAFKILDTASSSVNVGVLLRELGLAAPSRCRLHLDWIRRSEQATAAAFTLNVKVVTGRCIPLWCIRRCCGWLLSGPVSAHACCILACPWYEYCVSDGEYDFLCWCCSSASRLDRS
jgi:hypothetical protein